MWSWVPDCRETTFPGRVNFSLCRNIETIVYVNDPELPQRGWEGRQLGLTSCLTLAGRVTLAGGKTCLHINTLARPTGTTLGVASVTKCLGLSRNLYQRNEN